MNHKINIKNKKAAFSYHLFEKFTVGIVLKGTEIKSIRAGKASLVDSYCTLTGGELFVKNLHIAEYSYGNQFNHEPKRERKLLMTKRELKKIAHKVKDVGITIIPTLLFINEKGYAKLEIALAKGKKAFDKRETLKKDEMKREIERGSSKYKDI